MHELGELEDQFKSLRLLGRGGMASVHLVRRHGARDFSVLKLVRTDVPIEEYDRLIARLEREADLLAVLDSPVIPRLLSRFTSTAPTRTPYLEMEFIPGIDLKVLGSRNGIPPVILVPLAKQYLSALAHAHGRTKPSGENSPIIHRDLSPHNLMVTFDGLAKLIDFGVAHADSDEPLTVTREFLGKTSYASPEQISGLPVDGRSDLYSIAVTLLELFSGKPWISPKLEPFDLLRAVKYNLVPRLSELARFSVPAQLDDFFKVATRKDPNQRFQTAAEMLQAFDEATAVLPKLATPEQVGRYVRKEAPDQFNELKAFYRVHLDREKAARSKSDPETMTIDMNQTPLVEPSNKTPAVSARPLPVRSVLREREPAASPRPSKQVLKASLVVLGLTAISTLIYWVLSW